MKVQVQVQERWICLIYCLEKVINIIFWSRSYIKQNLSFVQARLQILILMLREADHIIHKLLQNVYRISLCIEKNPGLLRTFWSTVIENDSQNSFAAGKM